MTIFDSSDLTSAIQLNRTLKLTVFLLNKPDEVVQDAQMTKGISNAALVRKELAAIRDRVIQLLDHLDLAPQEEPAVVDSPQQLDSEKQPNQPIKQAIPPVHAKEFDPYQQADNEYKADKVSQAFGIDPTVPSESTPSQINQHQSANNQPNTQGQLQSQAHTLPAATTPIPLAQPQGTPTSGQHPIQAQPPLGSPYPPTGYHQQRFPTAQPASSYPLPNQQQPNYPQGSYNPQPSQQPYGSNMSYGSQPVPSQQQQQPAQRITTPYTPGPGQAPQTYNQTTGPQNPPLGQPAAPSQPAYSYPNYPPGSNAPANPYSRGAQPQYGNRPQPPQYQ